jgi:hypothetical protein
VINLRIILVTLLNKFSPMRTKILMPQYEPTDKELNDLMKDVILKVKKRANLAATKFNSEFLEALKKIK